MTAVELEVVAAEIVARTRAEQGLPRRVEDAAILARVAAELRRRPNLGGSSGGRRG